MPWKRKIVAAEAAIAPDRNQRMVPIGQIAPAPWNPREEITAESVSDLVASIKNLGLILPILVRMVGTDKYQVVSGHRRLEACRALNMSKVLCDVLLGVPEDVARRMTFIENLQRRDAEPLLEAELVAQLCDDGLSTREIAAETGRTERWVKRRMCLKRLSDKWRALLPKFAGVTVDALERIAAYPPEIQDDAAAEYDGMADLSDLQLDWDEVEYYFRRREYELADAPFDTSACAKCWSNSAFEPDLFADPGEEMGVGRCLKHECYRAKCAAALKAARALAKKRGAKVFTVAAVWAIEGGVSSRPDAERTALYIVKDSRFGDCAYWGVPRVERPAHVETEDEVEDDDSSEESTRWKALGCLREYCDSDEFADTVWDFVAAGDDRVSLVKLLILVVYFGFSDFCPFLDDDVCSLRGILRQMDLPSLADKDCETSDLGGKARAFIRAFAQRLANTSSGRYVEILEAFPSARAALTSDMIAALLPDEEGAR